MTSALIANFFVGLIMTNGVPHFVNSISGNPFQTPFASPPAVGESSPIFNVLWGMTYFLIGLWLVKIGDLRLDFTADVAAFTTGSLLIALTLAWHFGRVRKQ